MKRQGFSEPQADDVNSDYGSRTKNARFSGRSCCGSRYTVAKLDTRMFHDSERCRKTRPPDSGSETPWEQGATDLKVATSSRLRCWRRSENFVVLAWINRELIGKVEALPVALAEWCWICDSIEIPAHTGSRNRAAYNGHFESTCYHATAFVQWSQATGGGLVPIRAVHSAEGL